MNRLWWCGIAALSFLACKGDGDARGKETCQRWCVHEDNASRAIAQDLARADRAATELEKIEVSTDAEIKAAGEHAANLCSEISASFAHATGIAWSLGDAHMAVSQLQESMPLVEAYEQLEKAAAGCAGRSPAQIKAGLVAEVHALAKRGPPPSDAAACATACVNRTPK